MALSTKARFLMLHALGDPAIMDEVADAIDAANEIATSEIADDAVTFAKLQNSASAGRSVLGKTATGAGDFAEIATTTANHVLRYDGTNIAFGTLAAGSLASDAVTTAKILDANVTYAKIVNGAGTSVLGKATTGAGVNADITGTDGQVLRVSGTTVGFGTIAAAGLATDSVETAKILNANVTKAKLAAGISGSHMIVAAGTHTTVGGDANETITATGALGTDTCQVSVKTKGGTPRTMVAAAAGTDNITLEMSGDPSNDHVLQWCVIRATS